MEVDERLRWLEARVSSSLRPRGEELRRMLADEDNRAAFLSFCNHTESRCLFVHLVEGDKGEGGGVIQVSSSPPAFLFNKAMVFLKCSHASKLNRESLAQDVTYAECSTTPLAHLDSVLKEVYLPLITSSDHTHMITSSGHTPSPAHMGDQLLDLLHRISSSMQITHGYTQGKVVLPLPSVSALAETALISPERHSAVVHVLETAVVTWMKQVKMALHCDPSGAIFRKCGSYAGPMEEIKFWQVRQQRLESVRDQLSSVPVLTILHNLELARSTYAQAFSLAQHDIVQALREAEQCLVFLSALRPWLLRLCQAHHADTITSSFPPLMATLLLVWQHSWYYSQASAFHRLLTLLSNEMVGKVKDIVGENPLADPLKSLSDLKLALRICAAFRGCYLDYKEKADTWLRRKAAETNTATTVVRVVDHTPWPLRNSQVFYSVNATMERCNDLMELVHTIHDFSELEAVGVVSGGVGVTTSEAIIGDIYAEFTAAVQVFTGSEQDLLTLGVDGCFESQFFSFRRVVQRLESELGRELGLWLHRCPSLRAQLRVMEMFQYTSRREAVKVTLTPHHRAIVAYILSDMEDVACILTSHISHPPLLPHTPPTASKLLWLNGLGERVGVVMETLKNVAPQLLEGELGWRLRQAYGGLVENLQSYRSEEERRWVEGVPRNLSQKLTEMVLAKAPDGELVVNFDPLLLQVIQEVHHLSCPPLNMRMPPVIKSLMKAVNEGEVRDRHMSLELVMQTYRDIQAGMKEEERVLLHNTLQQVEILLSSGLSSVDWLSAEFPDFLAKCKAAICVHLHSSLSTLHSFTSTLHQLTRSWTEIPGLDIFKDEKENTLQGLQRRHSAIMEHLDHVLPSSMSRIHSNLASVLSQVHASPESPAWAGYLRNVDHVITERLKDTVLTAVGSLLHRAHLYEQGVSIPALMVVKLELVGGVVTFSPPLVPHFSLPSIPEVVAGWMESYVAATRQLKRVIPNSTQSYQEVLTSNPTVHSALTKISAHLETNSRQAQSLRRRFSNYSFLWEQDVQQTFRAFLKGEAAPHPRRLLHPETVRSRSSTRLHSGRPKSSQVSMSQQSLQQVAPDTSNMHGVMGVSDWDFLCPPGMEPGPDEDISKRPSLDEFDGELALFQGICERLSNTVEMCDVGWVCVDQRPVKHILTTLTSKWKAVYAGYLERQISQVLNALELFFHEVEPEVEKMGGEGSHPFSLMSLMAMFNKVNAQQVVMDKKFGAVHRAVMMLDRFSHPLPPRLREQFNTAPHRWSNLKKRIALGKQRMGPYIQSHSQAITSDLLRFGQHYAALYQQFTHGRCLHHECGHEEAMALVRRMSGELGHLQREASNLTELQELLGTSVFNFSLLKEFDEELSTLEQLWTLLQSVRAEHTAWQSQQWHTVDCPGLEEATRRQAEAVESLPSFTHSWDVYQHLVSTLQTIQLTLPLVEGLRSTAMRPRHWKQVLRCAMPASPSSPSLVGRAGALNIPALEQLTLGELMAMQLHDHSGEVLQVVERANKEVAIEALLNTFEEVWLSRQLELVTIGRTPLAINRQETVSELGLEGQPSPGTPKSRIPSARVTSAVRRSQQSTGRASSPSPSSTPHHSSSHPHTVQLLHNTEGIFETLESHQTSLQTVVGTAAAASFTDELCKWQKQLQTIEAVLEVWLQVQALWVQLEVYQSPEVQQHLPTQSYKFSSVDREWRELLSTAAKNPSVMAVCLKEGLLVQLEKLHSSLLHCCSTLVQYAEGQRARCHWFHFMPLEDVLQFICCGSQLDRLSSLIHKLLPPAWALLYNHSLHPHLTAPPSLPSHHHLPKSMRITGIVSRLGERLDLGQSVPCAGSVEGTITSLLTSLTATLRSQLNTAISSFVCKSESTPSPPSLLSSLPPLWTSQLATQVILLATQLGLDLALTSALRETEKGHRTALESACTELDELVQTAVRMLQGQPAAPEGAEQEQVVQSRPYPPSEREERGRVLVSLEQSNCLQSILLILYSHRQRLQHVEQRGGSSPTESFAWQSRLRWSWSGAERTCHISTVGAGLPYGCHYTGSSGRVVLTPSTERALVFLLQAACQGYSTVLSGREGNGKSCVVHELATVTGRPLFSLHCSPSTTSSTILSYLQGMALTGCWLFLQSVDNLLPAVLHTACTLLQRIQQACSTKSSSLPWPGETLQLNPDIPSGVCFASSSVPHGNDLSPDLRQAFTSCSIDPPEKRVLMEALLLAHEFHCHRHLSQILDTFFSAANELFNRHPSIVAGDTRSPVIALSDLPAATPPGLPLGAGLLQATPPSLPLGAGLLQATPPSLPLGAGLLQATPPSLPLGAGLLQATPPNLPLGVGLLRQVVVAGQKYLQEFDKLGVFQLGGPLHEPSMEFSDVSEGTRASLRLRATTIQQTQHSSLHRQSFEELSILLSLKDLLLPQLSDTTSLSTLVLLLSDLFPSCDITGVLAHEEQTREGLTAQAGEDNKAGVSARESRAASAMMVVREEHRQPSEVSLSLEDHIVQACLLDNLVPSPNFQLAVAQLLSLLQSHLVVGVVGSCCSGKSAAIQVAASTHRGQGEGLALSWVVPGALQEGDLFGMEVDSRWQEGLLPQLLHGEGRGGGKGARWVVLDGSMSGNQLDTLLTLLDPDQLIKLSNGRGIPIETTCKFILELPSLSALTPRAATCLPHLCLSPSTVSWWDSAKRWLLSQPSELASLLEPLLQRLLPLCLGFLAPVLRSEDSSQERSDLQSATVRSATSLVSGQTQLQPQELRLVATHLVNTCCNVLEALLSPLLPTSPTLSTLKRHLACSLVWSMGGHLSPPNKTVFSGWWREAITDPDLALPEGSDIWDYFADTMAPGLPSSTGVTLSGSGSTPFVHTRRAVAMARLVGRLISQGRPVFLVGKPGSGKTSLLLETLKMNDSGSSLQHVYASQFTTGQAFWSRLKEHLQWQWGRNYAPVAGKKLVCFIDDLHNSSPCGSLGQLVRGHMTSGGVWEGSGGRWHSVGDVSYVCTAHCSDSYQLDVRLAKHFTVLHWEGYDSSDLETVFSTILSGHLSPSPKGDVISCLVQMAVQVHCQLSSLFLPSPERQHYLFNLRHIANLFRQLCLGSRPGVSPRELLLLWQRQSWWVYGGVLASEVDRERYWETVSRALRKHFSQSDMLPELLRPSSCHLPSSQHEALQSQLTQHLAHQPGLHINLYESTLEELHRLCHLITSPYDLSHMILVGHSHPDPLVRLAASHCGFTVVQPSLCFTPSLPTTSCTPFGMSAASYPVARFQEDLTSVYTEAGVKNQKLLLLVTSVELLHETFLGLLYEATCECHITHLYSRDKRMHIINSIRSEVTRAGLAFNITTAWNFFISRVRQNLRIVLAVPSLLGTQDVHYRELLGKVNIYYHQPWSQRDLVGVALHHLTPSSLLPKTLSEGCAHILADIHLKLRERGDLLPASNCTFQYLVERFVYELNRKQSHVREHTQQLKEGMECVNGAKERACLIEERLGREERVLEEKEEAYSKLLVQLGQDMAISQEHGRLVARQRERIGHLRKVIPECQSALQTAVQEKLSLVLHLKQQVMDINHESLTELRAQQRPPQVTEDLLAAVISIVKSPSADMSWTKGAKRLMANVERFRELLLSRSTMEDDSETIIESVNPILNRVGLSVDELSRHPGGLAATQLLGWVQGVVRLHSILQSRVRPLNLRLESMSASLRECEEKLRLQEGKMQVLSKRVSGLSKGLELAAVQCSQQREMVQRMSRELSETREFVEVLSEAKKDWEGQLGSATSGLTSALGSLVVSVCVPVYLASAPPHTQLHVVHHTVLPLLRERGLPVVWDGEKPLIGSFCRSMDAEEESEQTYLVDSPTQEAHTNKGGDTQTMKAPPDSTTQDSSVFPSYSALCRAVLPQVVPSAFSSQWLGQGHSLPAVLAMGLAVHSWHRWTLFHDPEGLAGRWLREWKGEEMMVVDYRERSFQFYLTIEQALICGDPLLVEGVVSPLDPALQPLLEMGHTWNGNEPHPVQFCGRKIQANPGFKMLLSTFNPPSALPPTLTSIVCVVDFSPVQPWAEELLLRAACDATTGTQQCLKVCGEVMTKHQKVKDLEKKLLSLLCSSKNDDYWRLTQKVAGTVSAGKEAEAALLSLRKQLHLSMVTKAALIPLTYHGSLTYELLHECAFLSQHYHTTWPCLLHHFTAAIKGCRRREREEETDGQEAEVLENLATAVNKAAEVIHVEDNQEEREREEREREDSMWRREVLVSLATSVMKDAARVLPCAQRETLGCALTLLTFFPHHHPPSLIAEQLACLAEGDGYLQEAAGLLPTLPSRPSSLTQELWAHLHTLPLSAPYFSQVIASTHTHTNFWAGITQEREKSPIKFPWQQDDGRSPCLDDLVLLSCVCQPAVLEVVGREVSTLNSAARPPLVSELLTTPEGAKRKPLLLLHDENQLVSEVNLSQLQEELQHTVGDKSVQVLDVASATDKGVWLQLATPTTHCLLVTGLCQCDPKWIPLASARLEQASNSGCVVVAVVSEHSQHALALARDCQIASLSNLSLRSTTHLPPEAWQNGLLPSLLYLLSSLPQSTISQLSSLPTSFHPLLFHLSLLHCALYHRSKLAHQPTPSLSLFCSSLSLLLSLPRDHPLPYTLHCLKAHVLASYGSHHSGPVLEGLVSSCLDQSTMVPGSVITLALGGGHDMQVVTPGAGVLPRNYGDHVIGMMSSETHRKAGSLSKQTLSDAIYKLLFPLLAKLPGADDTLSLTPPPPSSHPVTTTRDCIPKHPDWEGGKLRGLEVCDQLPSSQLYQEYVWRKAMHQAMQTGYTHGSNSTTLHLRSSPEQDKASSTQ